MRVSTLKTRWAICSILLSTLLCVSLTGCGTSTDFALPYRNLLIPDINPVPYDQVKNGGSLRLWTLVFPPNFNYNETDGAVVDLGTIDDATAFFAFKPRPDGSLYYDPAYFTDVTEKIVHGKQTIIYTINPLAHWSNGVPITWHDFAMQAHALSGKDPRYEIVSSTGYDQIESVLPGRDDRQVIVTMKRPFGEWEGMLFSPMFPASVNETPDKFNTSLINHTPPTAGPFTFDYIDPIKKVVVLKRDPHWWGRSAKLDQIRFTEVSGAIGIEPYLSHEFDGLFVNGDVNKIQRALKAPHTVLRRALSNEFTHLTINEAPGRLTQDIHIRHAIAKAIDRQYLMYAFNKAVVGKNFPNLNSHFFLLGQKGYQDNSGGLHYNPVAARQELEEDGWKMGKDGVRYKNGQSLTIINIDDVEDGARTNALESLLKADMENIGIRMINRKVPNRDFFPTYIETGNFDVAMFVWASVIPPISTMYAIFYRDPPCDKALPQYNADTCQLGQNYGLQGNAEINSLLNKILSIQNDDERIKKANEVDKLIWQNMGQLPLMQSPLVWAMDSRLANYGPQEVMDSVDWTAVGWMK